MPRSAIIWTRSRELSLKVRYHLRTAQFSLGRNADPFSVPVRRPVHFFQAVTAGSRAFEYLHRPSELAPPRRP